MKSTYEKDTEFYIKQQEAVIEVQSDLIKKQKDLIDKQEKLIVDLCKRCGIEVPEKFKSKD